jgi:hypothetical protein
VRLLSGDNGSGKNEEVIEREIAEIERVANPSGTRRSSEDPLPPLRALDWAGGCPAWGVGGGRETDRGIRAAGAEAAIRNAFIKKDSLSPSKRG